MRVTKQGHFALFHAVSRTFQPHPPNTQSVKPLTPIQQLPPDPVQVIGRWPAAIPLAVRWNADPESGNSVTLGLPALTRNAITQSELESLLRELTPGAGRGNGSGWFGWVSYEAGKAFESAAAGSSSPKPDHAWPLASFQRIESSISFDLTRNTWSVSSDPFGIPWMQLTRPGDRAASPYFLPRLDPHANREQYTKSVERAIEYIRAGDVYQVNLAHRLSAPFTGSPRSLFAHLASRAKPWHGGYYETGEYALASISPELFLEGDLKSRAVRTRPMKGTRAFSEQDHDAAHADLTSSAKDRAELAMIVDLMRNDLGRICELGSVRVEQERRIERHQSGVLQSTATVAGKLRAGSTLSDVLRATFPPGSVTGAPKIRAMQIIDELEPVCRGPYCGTMIWLGDDGRVSANVMIRTLAFNADRLDYSVGAGIVADSRSDAEWLETLDKASMLLSPERKGDQAAASSVEVPPRFTGAKTRGS